MRSLLIGCGQGGTELVEMIMRIQHATFGKKEGEYVKKQFDSVAFNTDEKDLEKVDQSLIEHRLLVGSGYTASAGHGTGGNPRMGANAAHSDYWRIAAKIEEGITHVNKNPDMQGDIDAFIVCATLGGGTGSGMGPVIAKLLKENYFEDQYPVIGLVILPAEEEGALYSYNAYHVFSSWLYESNFDGIITVSLGGKFLNYRQNSEQYYANFDKAVAKALYILFGGGAGRGHTVNVDVSDILGSIKDGGGICTLGHLSTRIKPTEPGEGRGEGEGGVKLSGEFRGGEEKKPIEEGWQAQELLKNVNRLCNKNNLLLPVNFKNAKSALLVVKDSEDFEIPEGSLQAAHLWLERNMEGIVRSSAIKSQNFELRTDNGKYEAFEKDQIMEEDVPLSNNVTVESAVLLSGLSNIPLLQRMKEKADRVERVSRPSRGKRLLAETFGKPIGKEVENNMLLPCSEERENLRASLQSRACEEAVSQYVKELARMLPDQSRDEIRRNITVADVDERPDIEKFCSAKKHTKAKYLETNCFNVDLIYESDLDDTYHRRNHVVRVKVKEKEPTEIGQKITWAPTEFLRVRDGWTEREKEIRDSVLAHATSRFKGRRGGHETGKGDLDVSGMVAYPVCHGEKVGVDSPIYKVKVSNITRIAEKFSSGDQDDIDGERRKVRTSFSEDSCSGPHTKYFKYYFWQEAFPHPKIWECEDMSRGSILESEVPSQISYTDVGENEGEVPDAKGDLERINEEIDSREDGYPREDLRNDIIWEKNLSRNLSSEIRGTLKKIERIKERIDDGIIESLKHGKKWEDLSTEDREKSDLYKGVIDLTDNLMGRFEGLEESLRRKLREVVHGTLSSIKSSKSLDIIRKYHENLKGLDELLGEELDRETQRKLYGQLKGKKKLTEKNLKTLKNVIESEEEEEGEE